MKRMLAPGRREDVKETAKEAQPRHDFKKLAHQSILAICRRS